MEKLFITDLMIEEIRHLENIHIPLSKDKMKHLIFTGKNGSGKTSVLDAIAGFLNTASTSNELSTTERMLRMSTKQLDKAIKTGQPEVQSAQMRNSIRHFQVKLKAVKQGVDI